MKKCAGSNVCLISTGSVCEQSKIILLKKENVSGYDLNGSSAGSASEHSEETLQKMKKMASESMLPASKQPEGILQLIDKLETIVDKLLPR